MQTIRKYALITGAGMGLGKAIATELARRGHHLLLLARPGEELASLCHFLSSAYNVDTHFLEIDFTAPDTLKQIELWVQDYAINILINNAGIGGSSYFDQTNIHAIDAIIQVNIRTMVLLTRILIRNLQQHTPAYILNIASMASCCPIAFKTVYPASKSFVYSFSRCLNEELKPLGISVSVVLPGPIKTNKEVSRRISQQGWWVNAGLLSPHELAQLAIKKMMGKHKVVIPGSINKINWLLLKLLPKGISIPLVSRAVRNEIQVAVA